MIMHLLHGSVFVVVLASLQKTSEATARISIKLNRYINPGGKGNNGNCCDGFGFICKSKCDHYFTICLDNAAGASDDIDSCALGRFITAKTEEQDNIEFGSTIGTAPNPHVLDIPSWPGEALIKVLVMDADGGNNDDLVDRLLSTLKKGADADESSASVAMLSVSARTRLDMEVSVYCDPGWYGPACDVQCTPSDGPQGHYDCHTDGSKLCFPGWTGSKCEMDIDECGSSPCGVGGDCQDHTNGYICVCHLGYTGEACETGIDACESQPCHNGGTCVSESEGFNCSCPASHKGPTCESKTDVCESQPCQNGGTCIAEENGYFKCSCPSGYQGESCETDVDECKSDPCQNGGTCTDLIGGFNCSCSVNYKGLQCEVGACDSAPCLNGGQCNETSTGYVCECPVDKTGALCESDIHACDMQPCKNNGTCIREGASGFTCQCPSGWVGPECSITVTTLKFTETISTIKASTPSITLGTSKVAFTIATTEASTESTVGSSRITEVTIGATTEATSTATTASSPSLDVRTITSGIPKAYLKTSTPVLDPCISSPCEANATCIVTNSSYQCKASCNDSLCSGRGLCVAYDGINQCSCFNDYTGKRCETDINSCKSNPCQHNGQCVASSGYYTCRCQSGFTGLRCESDIDECKNMKCQHGGTCTNTLGNYICSCLEGFTGVQCESSVIYNDTEFIMKSSKIPAGKLYFGGKLEESDVAKIWVIIQKIINEEKAGNNKLGIKSYYQQKDCSRDEVSLFVYKLVLNGKAVRQELVEYVERMLHTPEVASKLPLPTATRADCEYSPDATAKPSKTSGWLNVMWLYLLIVCVAFAACIVLAICIIMDRRKHHWVVSKSEAVFKLVSKQPVGPSNSGPRVKYRQPSAAEETMLVDMSRASRSSTSDMGAGPRNFRLSSTFN